MSLGVAGEFEDEDVTLGFVLCCCFRVWSVRYNHSHDQLLLTGSSDSRVILSNMVSISSEPFGHLVDDDDLSDNEESQQEDKYTPLSLTLPYT